MEERSSNRQTYIIIGLIALIILLLLTLIDIGGVIDILLSADWRIMAAAAVFLVLGYLLLNLRWRYLLGNQNEFRDTLNVTSSGYMFAVVMQLPTTVYRVLVMERKGMAKVTETSSAVAVEVILGFIMRLIGVVLTISFLVARSREAEDFLITTVFIVAGLLLLFFLFIGLRKRLEPLLARLLIFLPGMDDERAQHISASVFHAAATAGSPKRFGIALLISIVYWLTGLGFYAFAAQAFAPDDRFQVLAIAAAAMTIVPTSTPMMIGVYHGLLIAVLVGLRLAGTTEATSYAIVVHLIQMGVLLLMGSFGLRRLKLNAREIIQEVRARMRRGEDDLPSVEA